MRSWLHTLPIRESLAEEKARLKALRSHDIDGYKKLLEHTKNERLQFLIAQTDEYLTNLGAPCHIVLSDDASNETARRACVLAVPLPRSLGPSILSASAVVVAGQARLWYNSKKRHAELSWR
jgi:hypothetical protein